MNPEEPEIPDDKVEDFDTPSTDVAPVGTSTPQPPQSPAKTSDGLPWGLVAFLILAVVLALFTVQNTQNVALNFMNWSGEFPLIMIIVGVFAVGVILDEILGTVLRRRRRRRKAEKAELAHYRKQG